MPNQGWGVICLVVIGCITLGIPMLTDSKIVRTIACVLVGTLGVVSVILYAL